MHLLATLAAAIALAQFPSAQVPDYAGPQRTTDGYVTFVLRAPRATEVLLWGDWMVEGESVPLRKGSDGGWSVTAGPLRPGIYLYAFAVDGVRMPDPRNRRVKNGYPGVSSVLEVGSEAARPPLGTVHTHAHPRRMHVYVPKGGGKGMPVLILLHGSWDTASDWIDIGRAPQILDQLIEAGQAKPMILVTVDGHPLPTLAVSTRPQNLALLDAEITEKVIPLVERTYGASPHRRDRAIAGLSMGGMQALSIGLKHADLFDAVGAFSAPGGLPAVAFAGPSLLWLSCGRKDPFYAGAREVHTTLNQQNVRHQWIETDGAHTWIEWRDHLRRFLPLLFKNQVP